MKRLLTTEEVAEYLGVTPKTMANWASSGIGPDYHKINGRRRYDQDDVQRFVAERKVSH